MAAQKKEGMKVEKKTFSTDWGTKWDTKFDIDEIKKENGWSDDDVILGIDEAGRGPMLGSMTYSSAYCRIGDHATLVSYGVNDSKQLSEQEREACYEKILSGGVVHHEVREITAEEISRRQLGRAGQSLNKISHEAAIELGKRIKSKVEAGQIVEEGAGGEPSAKRQRGNGRLVGLFVDVVGPQIPYQEKLMKEFPGCLVVVISKADARFPITGAASIVAKVQRDRGLKEWKFVEDIKASREFGCGYPSDPVTCKWMRQNVHKVFAFPRLARFDWEPVKKSEKENCVEVQWKPPPEDGETARGIFGAGKARRWQYFQEMWLDTASTF